MCVHVTSSNTKELLKVLSSGIRGSEFISTSFPGPFPWLPSQGKDPGNEVEFISIYNSSIASFVWKPAHFEFEVMAVRDRKPRSRLSKNVHLGQRIHIKFGELSSLFIAYNITIS